MNPLKTLETRIRYPFKNEKLLVQAMTHSSYSYEHKMAAIYNNERLEFLGDAVLELTISDYLYTNFPAMPEGELTKFRANLVCEQSLSSKAREIQLGACLLLGKGEDAGNGRERDSILADAFEALIGAIYLDGGMAQAKGFITAMLSNEVKKNYQTFKTSDHKTYLQEVIQKDSKAPIIYTIISEEGPDHDKTFTAKVSHNNRDLGTGTGKSKKEAEQNAAYNAIKVLNF